MFMLVDDLETSEMLLKRIVNGKWDFVQIDRENVKVGDEIQFACSGRGRGGHYNVIAMVVKCNRKSFAAVESEGSYHPGMLWNVNPDHTTVTVVR
jgi:hypothetical protein